MTTPTTSRVSEEMMRIADDAYDKHWANCGDSYAAMRAALEAALASLGDVVAVSALEALPRFDIFSDCAHNGNSWIEVTNEAKGDWLRWSDLSAILNRGGK